MSTIRDRQAKQYAHLVALRDRARRLAESRLAAGKPGNRCPSMRYTGTFDRNGQPTNLEQAASRFDREVVKADSRTVGQAPLTRSMRRRQQRAERLALATTYTAECLSTGGQLTTTDIAVLSRQPAVAPAACVLPLAPVTVYAARKSAERLAYEQERAARIA